MAASKKSSRKPKGNGAEPNELRLKVVVDPTEDTSAHYINHAEIHHSLNEFGMFVARVPPRLSAAKLEQAKQSGTVIVEPLLHLLFPPTMVPGLIRALTLQREAYETRFGRIKEKPEDGAKNG